jgi:hypothetical protein
MHADSQASMTIWMDSINQALQNLRDGDRPRAASTASSAPQPIGVPAPAGQLILDDDDDDGNDDAPLGRYVTHPKTI